MNSLYSNMVKSKPPDEKSSLFNNWDERLRFPIVKKEVISSPGKNGVGIKVVRRVSDGCIKKSFEERVQDWVNKKVESGVPESQCHLPFLEKAPKLVEVECNICRLLIHSDQVQCSVSGCQQIYHLTCAKEKLGFSPIRSFKCPHHVCFICKQKNSWHCIRCTMAAHTKCAPWPDRVRYTSQPRQVICWRHPTDWQLEQHPVPALTIEEIFRRLPLPYAAEEFSVNSLRKVQKVLIDNKSEPTPYLRIRRNVYLVKKKHNFMEGSPGCTNCDDCVCRVQSISCSKDCNCSETCTNRPFRKEKKVKVAKTEHCGWGVEAAEPIKEGEFVIEYIGEVIDDAMCEKRLWRLKDRGDENFYLCEIRKNFTIDATYKGNLSRYVNHSCDPNCRMEKWELDGETRVGIFAMRSIEVGEPLTYDYRFVCFGSNVDCHCGASNCQGFLGTRRKIGRMKLSWHSKRKRTTICCKFSKRTFK
ncbi:hypothetical protein AQUCO_01600362v1 [Aquilegia coerulea]|uniref:Histone-lysine N-methyltransferase n=1 Tax=Aquilegia coerulea TaxID=218851 RepID=A0A2G5DRA6_AQUCA|nr:hypothetical protein AQUCO_01600362v1 [Aquilegia coerulea]